MVDKDTDDISLEGIRSYLRKLKTFYGSLVKFILESFKTYSKLIIAGVLIGAAVAVVFYIEDEPYYDGKASFTYYELHKRIYGEMIDKLSNLAFTKSYKSLGEKLHLSEKEAENILDIQAVNISGGPLAFDMSDAKHPFYIWVKLKDNKLADTLLVCLENYMNSNRQAVSAVVNNTKQMKDKIVFFKSQLQKLDSLKSSYRFNLLTPNINIPNNTINTFNPVDLYTESEKLFNATSDLESTIRSYKAVKILDQFVMADVPTSKSLYLLLLKYILIGFCITAFMSLFISVVKKI